VKIDVHPRRIVVCADDYGMSPGVNRAIIELIAKGRLNATSVMMPGAALARADIDALRESVAVARNAGHVCEIGLHVTLTAPFRPHTRDFRPTDDGAFLSLGRLFRMTMFRLLRTEIVREEINAQHWAFMKAFGRAPDFVDGHQHAHLFPKIRDAFLRAVKENAPNAWVRQCGQRAGQPMRVGNPKALILDALSARFRVRATKLGIRTNPAFSGAYNFNHLPDFGALVPSFLDPLPDGGVMMCHPGFVDDALRQIDNLTDQREREYSFLASDAFPAMLRARNMTVS
jgi:chitin disaccharide deacetylase